MLAGRLARTRPVAAETPPPPGAFRAVRQGSAGPSRLPGGDGLRPGQGPSPGHAPRPPAQGTLEKERVPAPREAGPSRGEGRGPTPRRPRRARASSPTQKAKGLEGGPGRLGWGRPWACDPGVTLHAVAAAFAAPRHGDRDRRPRGPRRWRASLPLLGAGPCSQPPRAAPGRPAPAEGPRLPRPRVPRGRPPRPASARRPSSCLLLQADVRGHWDGRALTLPAPRGPGAHAARHCTDSPPPVTEANSGFLRDAWPVPPRSTRSRSSRVHSREPGRPRVRPRPSAPRQHAV